jgi:hypothetical protein
MDSRALRGQGQQRQQSAAVSEHQRLSVSRQQSVCVSWIPEDTPATAPEVSLTPASPSVCHSPPWLVLPLLPCLMRDWTKKHAKLPRTPGTCVSDDSYNKKCCSLAPQPLCFVVTDALPGHGYIRNSTSKDCARHTTWLSPAYVISAPRRQLRTPPQTATLAPPYPVLRSCTTCALHAGRAVVFDENRYRATTPVHCAMCKPALVCVATTSTPCQTASWWRVGTTVVNIS